MRSRAVCSSCGPRDLAKLEPYKRFRHFEPGETLASADEPLDFVATVVEGHIGLRRSLPDGRRQIVGLLFPGDFLGRPMRSSVPYDADALDSVTLCTIQRHGFERLLGELPALEERLLAMALDELDAARESLLLLGRKTAREKVASFLLSVRRRTIAACSDGNGPGAEGGLPFPLPLGREDMADYLGLTIETVSRQMSAFKKAALIALPTPRQVRYLDIAGLTAETGEHGV
ncbi:MAG: helix-turn-helix domain-containing protein [Pseudomonadota bacterium]